MQFVASLGTAAPDRETLLSVAGRSLSSEAVAGAAGAVAAEIAGAPVVAVEASATVETIVAVVGSLAAGAVVVPVPVDAGGAERAHILNDSGAVVLLTTDAPVPSRAADLPCIPIDISRRRPLQVVDRLPKLPALLLYTSGTTGPPKGVPISAAAIESCIDALADAWAWDAGDVVAHGLPLFHVHGLVLGALGPLRLGARLVHTGQPKPQAYAAAVADDGATLLFGVPTVWSRLAADFDSCAAMRPARLLVSGSAALPVPVFEALRRGSGHAAVERYGMTETLITLSSRADGPRRPGWVGTPLAGTETRLRAEDKSPVVADGHSVGDLEVRGPTVMAGYHRLRLDTENPISADGWFLTGDVACVDGTGNHRIVGRRSTDLVNSGGYRIGTGEVEAGLLAHPGVSEAAVIGVPDDDLGTALVAYVVAEGVSGAQLIAFVAGELAAHKRPRRVELVDALPRNAMGKVNKRALGEIR